MPCKEVKSSKYQTRKSPAFHAKDCKGLTKKGKNGDYASKPDSKGIYKWVKAGRGSGSNKTKKVSGKYYDTHHNRKRPFRVFVDGNKVSIYKNMYVWKEGDVVEKPDYSKLIKSLTVKKVYIGKSTGKAASADHSPTQAKLFVGNSILLHVSGKKYMHIGVEIYEFEMDDKVEAYYSMVGNNDVPYPVLLGDKNVYFMLDNDHKYVSREHFPAKLTNAQWEDAYSMYYGHSNPNGGESLEKKYAKKMKGFHMIHKVFW